MTKLLRLNNPHYHYLPTKAHVKLQPMQRYYAVRQLILTMVAKLIFMPVTYSDWHKSSL